MATAATSLLGLALPVTGELSGTWGDTVNVSITALLDTAVAGTTTLSSDADVTLTTTTLAANQARQAVILWTAGGTVTRTITAPAQSKAYIVINKTSSSQSIKIVGAGPTTGVTIVAGTAAFVVWNGVDFVTASVTSTTGVLPVANGGTGVTTSTGTGSVVLNTSPTLVTPALGAATGTSLALTGLATVGTTLGVTGVSTLTGGAVIQGLTVGLGAGAVATNTAVGISALAVNSTGANNTAVGNTALLSVTSGARNTAVGNAALQANLTANNNTAVGSQAALALTTGGNNTAVGYQALATNSTGTANTATGYIALNVATGVNNTANGFQALASLTTGTINTAIGANSGFAITTGSKNVILGSYTGSAAPISATGSNFVVLSDGDGNIVASTKTAQTFALPGGTLSTGTGIAFPATQSASTDANTLDDYEEGTWTPTVEGDIVAGTQTYTWRKATYTKIGNRVIIDFEILVSAKDATTSGNISITGLPFTANANSGIPLGFAVVAQNGVTFAGADTNLVVNVTQSTTVLKVSTYPSTNNLAATALAAAFRILGTTHYYV